MKKNMILYLLILILFVSGCVNSDKDKQESDSSLTNINTKGILIVGTSPPYGPMEFYDDSGNIVGIDMDIAKEIASAIGVKLEIKDVDFDLLQNSIDSGEIDIAIASITITNERSEQTLFSAPYFNGGQVLVLRADDETINTVDDLNNKRIGVEDDRSSLKDNILNYVKNPLVKLYVDSEELPYTTSVTSALKNNTLDAFVVDYIAAISIIEENPDLKIFGEPFTQEFYGIATKKGNNELIDEINKILREMKRDGKLKEIENKWLN
jgi:polar amino acid transport system substrate-binding protein